MTRPFNRPELSQALAELIAQKGTNSLNQEETVVPTVQVADLNDTPFNQFFASVAGAAQCAAVAGQFSYVWARPAINRILQIKTLIIPNDTAAVKSVAVRRITAGNISSIGIDSQTRFQNYSTRDNSRPDVPSVIQTGTLGSTAGDILMILRILAGDSYTVEFPNPGLLLWGTNLDPTSGALAVMNETANESQRATFIGREWPLPL